MTQKPNPLNSIQIDGPIPAHLARAVIEETLRSAILDGRLPCGTALRQQDLADLFGVSRMPVREALRQLEAQALLNVIAHKGAVVAPLVQGDAAETYELRILLESEALRRSIPLLTDADIELAAGYIEEMETQNDYSEIGRLNRLFHMTLYSKAPNRRLLRLIEDGLNEEERFLRFNLEKMGLGKLSQEDHRDLLRAVEDGDIERSVKLLTQHLNRGVEVVARFLDSPVAINSKKI
ncbi:GntR family transcriptional regulator [Pseudomonas prosekii]|uniref:GntR family transcriptional regulator n=1 Tax=Pseudomonas prosekii TaxID=1148509 RepID=A0A3L8CNK9_9PSED|nr:MULTISPECIES: GntR family transcriptional regulator [Pseudomonas]RLU09493.1 GntR family transcriptional regulator [Pseudomonas prosekii]RLU12983.1 GntR family transcriptional regulator [Pseudomonas prosekii]TWD46124.1 GntR family transcriptional regulator [Pseudomonas sp. SJZ131]